MKLSKALSVFCVLLGLPLLLAASPVARADTWDVKFVHYDFENLFWVYGISSDGALTVLLEDGPCGQHNRCVGTYTDAVLTNIAPVVNNGQDPPAGLAFDNGSACSYSLMGSLTSGVCNNGRTAFLTGLLHPDQPFTSLYIADSSGVTLIANQVEGRVLLDADGDVFFDNTRSDMFYEGFRVSPTPEPSTLMLLGTGAVAVGGAVRRRVR